MKITFDDEEKNEQTFKDLSEETYNSILEFAKKIVIKEQSEEDESFDGD